MLTTDSLKKYQKLDPLTRQVKSWHNHKTKPQKNISLSWKTKQYSEIFETLATLQ